jgi:integrase
VEKLGYNPNNFAGHSLRAGLATSAAAAGKSERAIMNQTGHRSVSTVRRYIRDGSLFRENAADGLGL